MKTYLDCYPCFVKQALSSARLANVNDEIQHKILVETFKILENTGLNESSPVMAVPMYNKIAEILEIEDPYTEIKKLSNDLAIKYQNKFIEQINNSVNKLFESFKIAAAGNIIDFGAKSDVNIEEEIKKIKNLVFSKNDFDILQKKLQTSRSLLYIGDNAGEIVFDKLCITQIKKSFPNLNVIFAVRGKPIINDVTIKEANYIGLDKICKIISNGNGVPGTHLPYCSDEFKQIFKNADLIISKGQGNFETLDELNDKKIFFILKVKCAMIAKHINAKIGDLILLQNKKN